MLRKTARARDFLVARSPAMRGVLDKVQRWADGDVPVLILGEHGTGRELIARVLHQSGPRRERRFVAVRPTFDSSDVPARGATDVGDDIDDRAQRALRAANGGTLLVKDVVDVPAPTQRTLRKAIRPRGPRAPRDRDTSPLEAYDVRVVGSADLDLEKAVAAKILSRDLYEQLADHTIEVPPLRDRTDDLPELAERWVAHYVGEVGRSKLSIAARAHARLAQYPWPGNVAELKSIARRLVVNVSGSRIEAGDVDEVLPVVAQRVPLDDMSFEDMVKAKLAGFLKRMDGYPVHDLYDKVLERVERPLFDLVLEHTGGNQLKAADILGVNRNTLRKKLESLGLDKKKKSKTSEREDEALDGD
ncbi:MAG TPA: sigma 54-interacting transcriptional regulator [Kofleriaceae bacterium]|nr:sigma 54-interacting transcriptional regulator [Kofleriaceae bacterium]